jgi:protein phosphatase PTC7
LSNIHPLDVILDAWNLTLSEGVQGSSTICVATLDKKLNQLSYSNIGDCGLMVVRHIDSETAGYMRDRSLPRHLRKTDLKIAYISQQQLRSFNLPYQLGYSKFAEAETTQAFETPTDADTASIPVMPGDLIVLATDGLFDNLDLEEIVEEIYKWEQEFFSAPSVAEDLRLPSKKKGNYAVQQLAERLVKKARELSLDNQRDSPFAILAKENDIMWGGGMPDDTTVIVGRVVAV